MDKKECIFIINPQAGSGKSGHKWGDIRQQVQSSLVDDFKITEIYTKEPGNAIQISRQAVLQGVYCIISVGGDGTTNEVVNGFFEDGKPVWGSQSPCPTKLAIIPLGTGSDLICSIGLNRGVEAAIERIKSDKIKILDVGILNATNNNNQLDYRAFLNIASCGVATLAATYAKRMKLLPGFIVYHLAAFVGLLLYQGQRINIQVINDDKSINSNVINDNKSINSNVIKTKNASLIAVCNGSCFGAGFKVAPGAKMSDGKLDVVACDDYTVYKFARFGHHLRNGTYQDENGKILLGGISREMGTKIKISGEDNSDQQEQLLFEVDGEIWGKLPATVYIVPAAIQVVVDSTADQFITKNIVLES